MGEIPWSGPPEPYEVELPSAFMVDGVVVATVRLPPMPEVLVDRAGKPAILFQFATGPQPLTPIVLTFGENDDPEALVRLITAAVADLPRIAAATPPAPTAPPAVTHCPGCDVRLHGAVAERGGCLACFPTIPGDEAHHG